ncbi:ABC transporter, permease protein [Catonella morbi ATCC 51271]|uniref:ABC transporter, permease protein n=2 Tax=Catonella TaxID=43996 RepID=V2XK50_9FIRM|nr:ABC transporter, permease protein [Catonella morbi ATCC 51271]
MYIKQWSVSEGKIFMKRNKSMILAFTLPGTLLFFGVFVYPIIRTVIMSFFRIVEITDPVNKWEFRGFGNYLDLFNTPLFRQSLVNIGKIWTIGGIITLAISLMLAIILTSGIRGKAFFQAAIYLPNVISAVAMATMWIQYVFNSSYGFLTTFFRMLGLESLAKIQWLDEEHKFWALLISYCFGMIGHHMLIWISGIERISKEYYEASGIDGANKVQQFFHVTLPLLRGILRTNIIMWSIRIAGFFIWSQLFSPLTADTSTVVPMVYMYTKVFGAETADIISRDAGAGAAIGIILCVLVLLIFKISNKVLKDDDLEF